MLEVLKENKNILLIDIDNKSLTKYRFYVVRQQGNQVFSILPQDKPDTGKGTWFARFSQFGVKYVGNSMTKQTANRWYKKLTT